MEFDVFDVERTGEGGFVVVGARQAQEFYVQHGREVGWVEWGWGGVGEGLG